MRAAYTFQIRHQFQSRLAERIHQPGLLLEHAVDLEKPIIDWALGGVHENLKDAEALITRMKQITVFGWQQAA